MSFRDKLLQKTNVKSLKERQKAETKRNGDFLSIKSGKNLFRILPNFHDDAFYMEKRVSWLPFEVDGEIRKKTYNDARLCGFKIDLVDKYIEIAKRKFEESEKEDDLNKLKTITAWDAGIQHKPSYIFYALDYNTQKEEDILKYDHGVLEVSKAIKEKIVNLALSSSEEDDVLELDPFTDPDEGNLLVIDYNPSEKDAKKKYQCSMHVKKKVALDDEQLEFISNLKKLSSYTTNFVKKDLENQIASLELYDEENDLGIFESDEFQKYVKEMNKAMKERASTATAEKTTKDLKSETTKKQKVEVEEEEDEEDEDLPEDEDKEEEDEDEDDVKEKAKKAKIDAMKKKVGK
jgi:hypothetical protein